MTTKVLYAHSPCLYLVRKIEEVNPPASQYLVDTNYYNPYLEDYAYGGHFRNGLQGPNKENLKDKLDRNKDLYLIRKKKLVISISVH